jgi:UDPglucose 6-dehydrogenase
MNFVNAELSKISVNTFVTTKISYANMIADMCDQIPGADAQIVTRSIGSDSRIGQKYLKPAIGYGGPCFPRDNKAFVALGRKLNVNAALAEATDNINDYQINRIMNVVAANSSSKSRILIMGLAYKANTGVIEESQAIIIAEKLADNGYNVTGYDPQANKNAIKLLKDKIKFSDDEIVALRDADIAIIMTPWTHFKNIDWGIIRSESEKKILVIDPWGIIENSEKIDIIRLGSLNTESYS